MSHEQSHNELLRLGCGIGIASAPLAVFTWAVMHDDLFLGVMALFSYPILLGAGLVAAKGGKKKKLW
jgi:hypothetical protein